jgi:hypothetical protein
MPITISTFGRMVVTQQKPPSTLSCPSRLVPLTEGMRKWRSLLTTCYPACRLRRGNGGKAETCANRVDRNDWISQQAGIDKDRTLA